MDLGLAGQLAVVVGGANGIGLAMARAFAAEGARVALLDVDQRVEAAAAGLGGKEPAIGVRCDASQAEDMKRAAADVASRSGQADHVLQAAAVGSGKFGFPFLNLDPADWKRVLEVNILGAVHAAHAFAPGMIEARRGTFIFIASVAGQIGSQTDPPYSASKAALINFAQCMAKDLAPHGIRVNSISPGMVKTAINRSVWEAWNARQPPEQKRSYEDWAGEKIRNIVPLGRWQEADEIGSLAVFLASERARNITGQTINVDGGWVMHS